MPILSYYILFLLIHFLTHLGNVYIADTSNHRIRKVTVSTGIITTIAGTGTGSYSGDGGAATSATLNSPWGISLDSAGTSFEFVAYFPMYITSLPSPSTRQRVYRGLEESSYPQGDGVNRDFIHDCRHWNGYLLG